MTGRLRRCWLIFTSHNTEDRPVRESAPLEKLAPSNHLAEALAGMLRTQRHAVCVAASELRDRSADDPAYAAVWQAVALTAAEVDDAERELLGRAEA